MNAEALFDWGYEDRDEKPSITWREAEAGRAVFRNDQVITDATVDKKGKWTLHYYMARQPTATHEFRVPKDNQGFIENAVKQGVLKNGVPIWVTIERDAIGLDRWLKIEQK